jgi:hypothetical protein
MTRAWIVLVCLAGCYTGNRATRGVNEAWRGRSRAAIEARWGQPASVTPQGADTVLVWSYTTRHTELPDAGAHLRVGPGEIDAGAHFLPGRTWTRTTEVAARIDASGRIAEVAGPSLRWGPPRGANLRWGFLFGVHAGMGRLDDTGTMLPGGGLYIGGMLGPRLGLVGTYALASGKDDAGGAMGMAWGIAAQWWPLTRAWLRAGPAAILSWDPGFEDAGFDPGLTAGASYALIRGRTSFVLDLRLDLAVAADVQLGTVGVGVNIN